MNGTIRMVAAILVCTLVVAGAACSRFSGPSDEDILKAIDKSGILKSRGFELTGPVVILEKGSRDSNGIWPVRVKLSIKSTTPKGDIKQYETATILKITAIKDAEGKTTWQARL